MKKVIFFFIRSVNDGDCCVLFCFFLFFCIDAYTCLFSSLIDLLKIPPGFRVGMDFSSKGTSCFLTQKQQSKNAKQLNINFVFSYYILKMLK